MNSRSVNVDMDESNIRPTVTLHPYNNDHQSRHSIPNIENLVSSESLEKAVRLIPGPTGIGQMAKARKIAHIRQGGQECVMPTQEYIRKVVEDVGKNEDFTCGSWVSAIEFVNANGGNVSGCLGDIRNFRKNGKLEQVVAICKSCTPNALGDLTVTLKDLSSITIHHKVLTEGGYEKAITVGATDTSTCFCVFF